MAEPALVADCVKAMRDAVSVPVTVKHRTGIDDVHEYAFVRDFVGTVSAAGAAQAPSRARMARMARSLAYRRIRPSYLLQCGYPAVLNGEALVRVLSVPGNRRIS